MSSGTSVERSRDWDVVVVGGANYDYLIRGVRLPERGETTEGDVFIEGPGGKGMNQAVAAARLGARVAFIGRVGRDQRAQRIVERLAEEGVESTHVVHDPGAPTGIALVFVGGSGAKQIMTRPGANRRMTSAQVQGALDLLVAARVVLLQLEVPLEAVHAAAAIAKKAGVTVVLDPAPAIEVDDETFRLVDVVRPNRHEAEALTGIRVRDIGSARRAAAALMARGPRVVAVQAGTDGNLMVWPGNERCVPRLAVDAVDETGAGDAFAAAIAVGLAEGMVMEEIGRFATAAAALATTTLGAQPSMPHRDAVQMLRASSEAWNSLPMRCEP